MNTKSLTKLNPKDFGCSATFLETEENAEILDQLISLQTNMEKFDVAGFSMSNKSAYNLLKHHYSKVSNLQNIPEELYQNNHFFDNPENVQIFCQVVAQ